MASTGSDGTCHLCSTICSKRAMPRHLASCPLRDAGSGAAGPPQRLFHLLAQGLSMPEYWMHLEARATSTLQQLDGLLRRTWLECCGHLSAFSIDGQRFSSYTERWAGEPESPGERGMSIRLERALAVGTRFRHEYDFGTTTMLDLRVIAERQGSPIPRPLRLLARNLQAKIPCTSCADIATWVCAGCFTEELAWMCDRCAATHAKHKEYFLPVVNSPRVGLCAYTGPA